jgi:hypothetical protein
MRGATSLTHLSRRPATLVTARRIDQALSRRTLFWPFRRSPSTPTKSAPVPNTPILAQNDLFHPLSQSPFPALVDKANRIKNVSLCPTSLEHDERIRPAFDCPDCGWPTHATKDRWVEGKEDHQEYCGRLREVNEDEHDIRSGRNMNEFENLPGTSFTSERLDTTELIQQRDRNMKLLSISLHGIHSSLQEISHR